MNALVEEWSTLPINTLLTTWKAFPEEAVIAAKGGQTSCLTLRIKAGMSLHTCVTADERMLWAVQCV